MCYLIQNWKRTHTVISLFYFIFSSKPLFFLKSLYLKPFFSDRRLLYFGFFINFFIILMSQNDVSEWKCSLFLKEIAWSWDFLKQKTTHRLFFWVLVSVFWLYKIFDGIDWIMWIFCNFVCSCIRIIILLLVLLTCERYAIGKIRCCLTDL